MKHHFFIVFYVLCVFCKITVRFRGRELNYVKQGETILNQFIEALSDIAVPEKKPVLEGKNMFIILAKKAEK